MAKLGTPENPEVIEPGQRPRPSRPALPGRWAATFKILKTLVVLTAPALLLDYAFFSLILQGWREQNALSFLLGLVLVPMAFTASVLALFAGPLLLASLVMLVMGRAVTVNPRPLGRFSGPFKRFF